MKHMSFNRTVAAIIGGTIVAVGVGALTKMSAQTKPQSLTGVERLEGDWVRVDPNGSGDFGGLTSKFTPASLTPQATTEMAAMRRAQAAPRGPAYTDEKAHQTGQPYVVV